MEDRARLADASFLGGHLVIPAKARPYILARFSPSPFPPPAATDET